MEQKKAVGPIRIPKSAFENNNNTCVYWLGNAGIMINHKGTIILIDPILEGFDMPLMVDAPIKIDEIKKVDGYLITHCDNDHFSRITCKKLASKVREFHTTEYVMSLLKEQGVLSAYGHNIHDIFFINDIRVKLTIADHAWQNHSSKHATRVFKDEDFCGFYLEMDNLKIWMPSDSRLVEEQLHYEEPDVILIDISDSKWHIGIDGVKKIAEAYPNSILIPIHWGTIYAPKMPEFNGNPDIVKELIINPDRIKVLGIGEEYIVREKAWNM